ncbi:MAG: nucleotidyltransferase domain-containing protein [Chitinivibrionales bacterium]|nr:nucleotidyltransferase domain-containing protein [Chitinivibrionales bacterium]
MDSRTQAIIKNIVSTISHEKCLLFGSQARGDFTPDSDYDLLIVVGNNTTPRQRIELAAKLRKALAFHLIDADVIVESSEEFDYYREKAGSIVRNACEEGVAV